MVQRQGNRNVEILFSILHIYAMYVHICNCIGWKNVTYLNVTFKYIFVNEYINIIYNYAIFVYFSLNLVIYKFWHERKLSDHVCKDLQN